MAVTLLAPACRQKLATIVAEIWPKVANWKKISVAQAQLWPLRMTFSPQRSRFGIRGSVQRIDRSGLPSV
jgi:hypothetical protein